MEEEGKGQTKERKAVKQKHEKGNSERKENRRGRGNRRKKRRRMDWKTGL